MCPSFSCRRHQCYVQSSGGSCNTLPLHFPLSNDRARWPPFSLGSHILFPVLMLWSYNRLNSRSSSTVGVKVISVMSSIPFYTSCVLFGPPKHWLTDSRIEFKICVLAYKSLIGQARAYPRAHKNLSTNQNLNLSGRRFTSDPQNSQKYNGRQSLKLSSSSPVEPSSRFGAGDTQTHFL